MNVNKDYELIFAVPVGIGVDRRDIESIENRIPFDWSGTPAGWVVEQLGTVEVDVYSIDDFVEMCNDQIINIEDHWLGRLVVEVE